MLRLNITMALHHFTSSGYLSNHYDYVSIKFPCQINFHSKVFAQWRVLQSPGHIQWEMCLTSGTAFFLAHCELILRCLDVDVHILVVQIYHPIGDPRLYQNLAPANSLTRTSKFCGNIPLFFHHSMQPRHREPKAVISTFPCSSSALKHNPFANLHCFLSSLYSINIQSNCFMQNRRHCFRFTPCMFIIVSSGFGQWNPPSVPFRCDDLHGWTSPKARSMQDIQVNVGMGLFFMVCRYVWRLEYLEM